MEEALIKIELLDMTTMKMFLKEFRTVTEARAFVCKVRRGHKLLITSMSSNSKAAMAELSE